MQNVIEVSECGSSAIHNDRQNSVDVYLLHLFRLNKFARCFVNIDERKPSFFSTVSTLRSIHLKWTNITPSFPWCQCWVPVLIGMLEYQTKICAQNNADGLESARKYDVYFMIGIGKDFQFSSVQDFYLKISI